jgi:hypothetical protein
VECRQVPRGYVVDDHGDVEVAARAGLAPSPAAVEGNEEKALAEGLAQPTEEIGQPAVNICPVKRGLCGWHSFSDL